MKRSAHAPIGGAILAFTLLVQTTGAPSAASPPYPASPTIRGLELDWSTYRRLAQGSDQFPMTWAQDGRVYTSFQDGGGFGPPDAAWRNYVSIGIAALDGDRAGNIRGRNLVGGAWPSVARCFWRHRDDLVQMRPDGVPCENVGRAGKSVGILARDRDLFLWVSPGSGPQAYREARIYRTRIGSHVWERASWALSPDDPRPVLYPAFVQAGQDLAHAGDYIYLMAAGYAPLDPDELTIQHKPGVGGQIFLMRARKDADLLEASAYEWFAGMSDGDPTWSRDPAEKEAVFTDPAGVSAKTSAIWVASLGRYLLATEHGRIASGEMGVFEAESPWGPWRTVHYGSLDQGYPSLPDTTFLLHFVPNGFDDDGGFTLAFTGRERLDALNLVDGRFRLRP